MSCLIYAHNGDHCIGKCDSNCYNAISPECDCICRGMNHGVGLKKAQENTVKYVDEWIDKYSKEKNIPAKNIAVNQDIYQLSLF